eukprot:281512-Hanusia_phi.AAC.1
MVHVEASYHPYSLQIKSTIQHHPRRFTYGAAKLRWSKKGSTEEDEEQGVSSFTLGNLTHRRAALQMFRVRTPPRPQTTLALPALDTPAVRGIGLYIGGGGRQADVDAAERSREFSRT